MAKFSYNDLSIAYMLLCLAKQREAFKPEEQAGVDECIVKLYEFLETLKKDVEGRTVMFDNLEPSEEDQ
jgi:hypothetical protein